MMAKVLRLLISFSYFIVSRAQRYDKNIHYFWTMGRKLVHPIKLPQKTSNALYTLKNWVFIALGVLSAGFGLKSFLLPNHFIRWRSHWHFPAAHANHPATLFANHRADQPTLFSTGLQYNTGKACFGQLLLPSLHCPWL